MEIYHPLRSSPPREEAPLLNKKKVQFDSQPKIVHKDSIDRIMKKKHAENEPSCMKTTWKILTILFGIIIFPLGLYWWWSSRSGGGNPPHLQKILKDLQGQIGPLDGKYSEEDYRLVWKDTEKILLEGQYRNASNQTTSLREHLQRAISATKKEYLVSPFSPCRGSETTRFEIVNADPISLCGNLLDEFHRTKPSQMDGRKYNPVLLQSLTLLNPSGYSKPTIEGELYRRSGLAFCLDGTLKKQTKPLFPLQSEEVIYTPQVPLFRHEKTYRYALYEEERLISIISTPEDSQDLNRLIYNQLYTAFRHGHDAIVIPPLKDERAAGVYKEMLTTYFAGKFRKVAFAIHEESSPSGTFDAYASALSSLSPKITN